MKTNDEKKVFNEEKTIVKTAPAQEKKAEGAPGSKKSGAWKSVLIGGVPGIVLGVAGTLATEDVAEAATEVNDEHSADVGSGSAAVHNVAPVAEGVNDDMSFSEAFAAARAEVGPGGVFSWHGQVYGTYYKPEWDAMSDEQRQEYSQSVAQANVHPDPYTPQPNDPPIVDDNTNTEEPDAPDNPADSPIDGNNTNTDEPDAPDNPSDSTIDDNNANTTEPSDVPTDTNEVQVEIIGMTQVEDENGEVHDMGVGTVDGHDAAFLDLEGDGEVDAVIVDENDNGEIDANEVYDASGSGISMSDVVAQADYGDVAPDDGLYNDMPDYTNDADTSSLV